MAFRDNRQDSDIFKRDPIPWAVSCEISCNFLAEVVVSPHREADLIACGQVNASHFPDAPGIQHARTTVPVENKKNSRNKHTKGSATGQAGRAGLFATEGEETVGSSPRQEGPAGKRDTPERMSGIGA